MAKRENSNLKKLVREAKTRMTQNEYDTKREEVAVDTAVTKPIDYEEERLYRTVCEIASSFEDVVDPIGRLVDKELYADMNEVERERYVLCLGVTYKKLLKRYRNEVGN